MGNSKCYQINDEEMYDYFDKLLYDKQNHRLPAEWKVSEDSLEYGLTEHNVAMLLGSKGMLYERYDAEKQICLLETMEKFIHEYIGIEGLEELVVNNYGAIENSIFLEHDSEGNSKNIREHAKHQMKNAYLGSVLLLECNYLENVARNIYQAQSPITQYLKSEAIRSLKKQSKKDSERDIVKKLKGLSYKIFMVSSLLHDIGYPLAYYLRSAKQMTDYPPYLKILCPTVKTEFSELKAYLLDSKLFQLIDHKDIYEKYLENDHGVLSALSFLMHFYHNGKIYALGGEERCIIEMSAIAIYRHTDWFPDGKRMVYLTDPISYMVRLCDDMQEWERFKISINEKHNYLRCGKCGRRIPESGGNYICECGWNYKKITMIGNRKINYVCLCDGLEINKTEAKIVVTARFHLMKQLEILLEDYTAVAKSERDLEKVQKMLENQSLSPNMEIKFFLSNNPIMIIDKMIEESGKTIEQIDELINSRIQEADKKKVFKEFWTDFKKQRKNAPFGDRRVEKNQIKYGKRVKDYVLKYYGQIYSLYEILYDIF